jgi:DNA repair exonuclease SbcCD nuclease subunit
MKILHAADLHLGKGFKYLKEFGKIYGKQFRSLLVIVTILLMKL